MIRRLTSFIGVCAASGSILSRYRKWIDRQALRPFHQVRGFVFDSPQWGRIYASPTPEVYLNGPGMILQGQPEELSDGNPLSVEVERSGV
jgi:hypothetical protein